MRTLWGPGRERSAELSTRLQTDLPGVSFTCRGTVRFRQVEDSLAGWLPKREAQAVALAGVFTVASEEAEKFLPENAFEAEQVIAARLADWESLADGTRIEVKARLRLDLTGGDAEKAERFTEARRAARLDQDLSLDQMTFMRERVLTDDATASLWWLQRNLTGGTPETSWALYDRIIRPLIIHENRAKEPTTRFTETMLTLVKRIEEDPSRLDMLARLAELALQATGDKPGAEEIASLHRSVRPVPGTPAYSPLDPQPAYVIP